MPDFADLILTNARVITLEPGLPSAEAVAVAGDTVQAVGPGREVANRRGPGTRVIDCQGRTLLPGFNDAHCHLLATAATLTGVDCGPEQAGSVVQLQRLIQKAADGVPPGEWIRGFGYDHLSLAEGRHPTRRELDRAAPRHPVRLDHRTGHASVLNSLALAWAVIDAATPDPLEGVIQRDAATGEPTGLLLEAAGFLRQRLGSVRRPAQLAEGLARLNRKLLGQGITSVQDAGPENGLARWEALGELTASGKLAPRVAMMAGVGHLEEFATAGLRWGHGDDQLRLGHAKLMLTGTTGGLYPGLAELGDLVSRARRAGFPVAVHAVEEEAVAAAAETLLAERANSPGPPLTRRGSAEPFGGSRANDRIEHCGECPPELVNRVSHCGVMVVTQPGFLYWNGDRYLDRVGPDMLPHLYPLGALARAGVSLAFGSDAPVIDPAPWPGLYAALTRRTREGRTLPEGDGPTHGESVVEALALYCRGGAAAEGMEARKGSIRAGKLADLVLVDRDPTAVEARELLDTRVLLTIIGGQVVWEG